LGQGKRDGAGKISTKDADAFGEAVTVDIGLSGRKRYGIDVSCNDAPIGREAASKEWVDG
jgi:hypothetical protein